MVYNEETPRNSGCPTLFLEIHYPAVFHFNPNKVQLEILFCQSSVKMKPYRMVGHQEQDGAVGGQEMCRRGTGNVP